jgi:hypothetical protein
MGQFFFIVLKCRGVSSLEYMGGYVHINEKACIAMKGVT